MAVYSKDAKLATLLMDYPSLIPVVNRLGIRLGVGDKTVEKICEMHHIDSTFFLSIVNTFIDDEYFPSNYIDSFSLDKIIDYLEKTGEYYLYVQLKNIEHHFNLLIKISGDDNNLIHLRKFFYEMKRQLEESLLYEKDNLFPKLRNKDLNGISKDRILEVSYDVEDKLQDLLTFFVVHLHGNYDMNLCTGVVTAIFSLKKDINQNNRIRTRILIPLIEKLN